MCTSIRLISEDKSVIWGRTQEFMVPFGPKSFVEGQPAFNAYVGIDVPVGHVLEEAESPITFKHQVIGMAIDGKPFGNDGFVFVDGVNDAGISCGMLYFSNYANYGKAEEIKAAGKAPLRSSEYMTWALGNCGSLQEVIEKSQTEVGVSDTKNDLGQSDPFHFMFTDSEGNSIVMEPINGDGTFKVHENPLGVMTNSPTFDWHMTNLQNYTGLTNKMRENKIMNGDVEVLAAGKGSGLIGMPGDYTAQSRFVRAATLLTHSRPTKDKDQARDALFHILNSFDIANGVQDISDDTMNYNTQYTVGYDLKNKEMFVSMHENRRLQKVTMAKSLKEVQRYHINYNQDVVEMEKA
ncbi:choloylglycine hydrolase family protein [Vagococcus coleopterorum]|uniref:Choloylglycine hydrolase family protein n=1 Tax=Vagococcus coleopterorum TaxID=2714946 RepID=A0A6G8AL32_9ENTE|nr:choloylglycine hydrolase family protein [Vagococcus coleopterorum]QIL45669.1 choloylglycine hydrolase family protein [Vagococcus coleopterorum]